MQTPKAYIAPAGDYAPTLRAGIDWLGAADRLRQAGGIFIKPNLTYPQFRPGVTTTREVIEAALKVLTELNPRVVIGESDGGYGSFEIEAAFQAFDLYNLARRYGASVVNLSREPVETCTFATRGGPISLEMPRFILRENFVTVTLPVPKVHCMTGISLSFKNQWGCIPDMMRLRLHYHFNEIIGPINRLLNVGLGHRGRHLRPHQKRAHRRRGGGRARLAGAEPAAGRGRPGGLSPHGLASGGLCPLPPDRRDRPPAAAGGNCHQPGVRALPGPDPQVLSEAALLELCGQNYVVFPALELYRL